MNLLIELAIRMALVSMVAVGGATVVIPALHAQIVDQMHWVDNQTFTGMIAISQFVPGPNMLIFPLVGWHVAGLPGALVSTLAFTIPPGLLIFAVGRALRHHGDNPVIATLRTSVRPVSAGLLLAAGIILIHATSPPPLAFAVVAVIAAAALYRARVNPLWWLSAAGLSALLIRH